MTELIFDVPLPLDEDGFVDRACPSPPRGRVFKVLDQDIERRQPLALYCPFCRREDESSNFTTAEQQDYLERERDALAAHKCSTNS